MRRDPTFELLDAGDGRRLERFGDRTIDRPAPGAAGPRTLPATAWAEADLRFETYRGWSGRVSPEPWPVTVAELTLELRPMASGGVGLFPEQLVNVPWLEGRIADRPTADRPAGDRPAADRRPEILNLFAHTGLLTLVAARVGAAVVHVDAARPAVAWARHNAELSELADRPIRWIVDDAAAFVAREARRARRYDGLVLDPPSFGRSGRNRWRLLDDLPGLLASCASILADDAFVLLTAHTTGVDGSDLAGLVTAELPSLWRREPEIVPLRLEAGAGARLDLGWAVRLG